MWWKNTRFRVRSGSSKSGSITNSLYNHRQVPLSLPSVVSFLTSLLMPCLFIYLFCCAMGLVGSQFPDQRLNPLPSAVKLWSSNHWITGEFPVCFYSMKYLFFRITSPTTTRCPTIPFWHWFSVLVQTHRLKAQSHKTAPTSDASCKQRSQVTITLPS